MKTELLQKYISGDATETEKQQITEWIHENNAHMREYMAQRKLHDIALWHTRFGTEIRMKENKTFSFHVSLKEVVKIASIVVVIFLSTYLFLENNRKEKSSSLQSIYVPAGQRAEIMLADGTKVWLNSRTTLTFPSNFDGDTRNVKLDGEGYFTVTKNEKQPFIVETDKYDVKVLGTEFNVTAYSIDSIWEAALLKGTVEVFKQGEANKIIKLEPNTRARLKGNKILIEKIQELNYFMWREGVLCFNNISVKDMIEKLELYYGVDIVVRNTRIFKSRYTGKFRTKDGVEHVLKVLKLNNKFTYTKNDDTNVITIN